MTQIRSNADRSAWELLSAFVDGEVSANERAVVPQLLAEPENRQFLTAAKQMGDDLRALPRHLLDDEFATRVLQAIEQSEPLSADEDELADDLRLLPRYQLDSDFHLRVLAAAKEAEEAGWDGEDESIGLPPVSEPVSPAARAGRRWWLVNTALSAAAILAVMVVGFLSWKPPQGGLSPELQAVVDRPLRDSQVLLLVATISKKAEREQLIQKLLYQHHVYDVNPIRANSRVQQALFETQKFQSAATTNPLLGISYVQLTGKQFSPLWQAFMASSADLQWGMHLLADEDQRALEAIDSAAREQPVAVAPKEAAGIARAIETPSALYSAPALANAAIDLKLFQGTSYPLADPRKNPAAFDKESLRQHSDTSAVRILLVIRRGE